MINPIQAAVGGVVLVLGLGVAVQTHRLSSVQTTLATEQRDFGQYRENAENASRKLEGEYRELEDKYRRSTGTIDVDTATALNVARADAASARSQRDGLLNDYAQLAIRHRKAAAAATAASQCAPADPAAAMCPGMLSRLSERAERYAAFADAAHTAGRGCERTYDAVQ